MWRWKRESNPCTRFCRPLPKPLSHSTATRKVSCTWPTLVNRGADDETRTRDPHLGKVMRYQLRYIRIRDGDALKKRCIFAATTNTSLLGSQFTNHQVDRPFRRCALTHTAGTELQHCNSGQQVTAAVCVHPGKPRAMPCELNSCSFGSARRQVVTFFPSG